MQGSNRGGAFLGSAPSPLDLSAGAMALPSTTASPARLQDTAFEVFVKRAMKNIMDQASGRTTDAKKIREACQKFLESVNRGDSEGPKFVPPLSGIARDQVLAPLRLACNADIPRVVEPALGCIHKLVGHAYLQGESTALGRLEDPNLVSKITGTIAKCGESSSKNVQLAVIRGLLTLTTAEHFVLHGDCLLQAVRTVFNLAIGSDAVDIQRTARNALLQMLNTIVKRVTCFSSCLSDTLSSGAQTPLSSYSVVPSHYTASGVSPRGDGHRSAVLSRRATAENLGSVGELHAVVDAGGSSSHGELDWQEGKGGEGAAAVIEAVQVGEEDTAMHLSTPPVMEFADVAAVHEGGLQSGSISPRSHTGMEEEREKSIHQVKEVITMLTPLNTPAKVRPGGRGEEREGGEEGGSEAGAASIPQAAGSSPGRSAHLMNLAEAADLAALEAAMSEEQPGGVGLSARRMSVGSTREGDAIVGGRMEEAQRRPRDRRAAWKELRLPERDVVTVLGALCKLAAREGQGKQDKETYLQQGKLLALEMLVGTISSPVHQWGAVRTEFVAQLRQPLCVTLLRNCMSHDIDVVRYVTRLFSGLLLQPRLRSVMKAELGAFYPLLILRPMQAIPYDPPQLAAALHVLQELCRESSLQVEMFMNFDCELEESNLFERTTWSLKELVELGDPSAPPAQNQLVKAASLSCVLSLVHSLDAWAGPMRDKMAAAAASGGVSSSSTGDLTDLRSGSANALDTLGSSSLPDASEAERFAGAKQRKVSLQAGIAQFNQKPMKGIASLIAAGLIEDSPDGVVQFLRKNRAELDKAQVGEYMGHHEDEQVAVMHAYIDSEDFRDLRIDDALRQLLQDFRLPGEAQKIDRIMEKFAERYCKDNPGLFQNADAAYLLAFAIIMLNTDAHNPMVDDKMSAEDFVMMNAAGAAGAEEGGEGEGDGGGDGLPLPIEELHGIYERIQESEIKMRPDGSSSELSTRRLVAAVGLSGLMVPFRSARGRANAEAEQAAAVLERTRRMVSRSMLREAEWHTATQAEMAVPMLQVSGENLQEALYSALKAARSEEECEPMIDCYTVMIRLCALFGLDALCERLVESLVKATGIASSLAAPSDPNAVSQLAALRALVALAGAPESGMLGSSWTHILRCLSSLDMMVHNTHYHVSARGGSEPRGRSPAAAPTPTAGFTLGRMLGWMRGSGAAAGDRDSGPGCPGSPGMGPVGTPRSVDWQIRKGTRAYASPSRPGVVGQGPGAGHTAWAEGEGAAAVERVFAGSARMGGESVVVFVRALCAVSCEELGDGVGGGGARVHMLQRLVECAHHNLGRIRLVWARIWAALTPHVVGATCHPDLKVAMYAVDSLRQLVSKLLVRAELAHFTHQEEALRPFAAILRSCDSPVVRELTVQCIAQAITAHPRGLGSGWRSVLQALEVAAGDSASPVVEQALEALQPVVEALYRGLGLRREYFPDCLAAARAAALNQRHPELAVGGLAVLRTCGRRLAEAGGPNDAVEEEPDCRASPGKPTRSASEGAGRQRGDGSCSPAELWASRHRRWRDERSEWAQLTGVLVEVAIESPAEAVVTGALNVLMELLAVYGGALDDDTWAAVQKRSLGVLLQPPPPSLGAVQYLSSEGLGYLSPWAVPIFDRILTQGPGVLPRLFLLVSAPGDCAGRRRLLGDAVDLLVSYVRQPWEDVAVLGARMLQLLVTTAAPTLDDEGWRVAIRGLSMAAGADALQPLAGVPSVYSLHVVPPPPAVTAKEQERERRTQEEEGGNALVVAAPSAANGGDPFPHSHPSHLQPTQTPPEAAATPKRYHVTVAEAIRVRCHVAILIQRVIEQLHRTSAATMPPHTQLQMLDVLLDTVNRAGALNADRRRRTGMERMLNRDASVSGGAEEIGEDEAVEAGRWSFEEGAPLPGLMRQEAEGGVLMLQALRRCMGSPDSQIAKGAAERLLQLCSRVIQSAAADAARSNGGDGEGVPGPTVDGDEPTSSGGSAGEVAGAEGGEEGAGGDDWDEGIRAPLVVAALDAIARVDRSALATELRSLFPALTRLMCSSQPCVREALSALLQQQLPQLLPASPAAGA